MKDEQQRMEDLQSRSQVSRQPLPQVLAKSW